jgi:hypothetical protein
MGIDRHAEANLVRALTSNPLLASEKSVGKHAPVLIFGRPAMIGTHHLTPESLFTSLGATRVDCLDVSAFEGANILHDLNMPSPTRLDSQYSLIFDNGTMEHCFNIAQVFVNINSMLYKGGLVLHTSPLNNFVNHGFYQFSPCLFLAFYLKNGYEILEVAITGVRKFFRSGDAPNYEVAFHKISLGPQVDQALLMSPRLIIDSAAHPDTMVSVSFLARKTHEGLASHYPQQPIYDAAFSTLPRIPVAHL